MATQKALMAQPTMTTVSQSLFPGSEWSQRIVDSIVAGRSLESVSRFRKQPLANKLTALENAVVPPRRNETPDAIAALLYELVKIGAVRPEEMGPLYSDLLIRVHRYNSSNVQDNLQTLVGDIRSAQSAAIQSVDVQALSNQTVLNTFLNSIPLVVDRGQPNYEAFKQTLRLFVNEAPNVTVFRSGDATLLQVNVAGVNTVDLNAAFSNLAPYWGTVLDSEGIPGSITSKLSSNTRVLLFMLAPFTNRSTFAPDTFIAQIMQLYRETLADASAAATPEATEQEVRRLAGLPSDRPLNLVSTLGFLVRNRVTPQEPAYSLTPRQLEVLRFVQESLADRIDRNGDEPSAALDDLAATIAPSYMEAHGRFLRRLIGFFRVALEHAPSYFREMYSNRYWRPPQSFWSRDYSDFRSDVSRIPRSAPVLPPAVDEELDWDDSDLTPVSETSSAVATTVPPQSSVGSTAASSGMMGPIGRMVLGPAAAATAAEMLLPGSSAVVGPAAALAGVVDQVRRGARRRQRRARAPRPTPSYLQGLDERTRLHREFKDAITRLSRTRSRYTNYTEPFEEALPDLFEEAEDAGPVRGTGGRFRPQTNPRPFQHLRPWGPS